MFCKLFLLYNMIFLIGCASYFKRKECNKTNWYSHGKSVAMKGQRLDTDTYMNSCVKVEADVNYANADLGFKSGMGDYCKPTTAYKYGKKGKEFNFSMCDGGQLRSIKQKHAQGVVKFCDKLNGFRVGASGVSYNDICPEELETAFLNEYYKGRKKYLRVVITQKKSEIVGLELKLTKKIAEKNKLERRLDTINVGRIISNQVFTKKSKNGNSRLTPEQRAIKKRRSRITSDLSKLKRKIIQIESKIEKSHNDIMTYEKEIMAL